MHTLESIRVPLGVLLFSFMLCSSTVFGQMPQRELVILNWSEYVDPELVEKFEQQHNVKFRENAGAPAAATVEEATIEIDY